MVFEWDENKNNSNIKKYLIDFNDAKSVFDGFMLLKEDIRKDYGEKRFIGIGMMHSLEVVIVWTKRQNNIRIISARKANAAEREKYHEIKNRLG